VQVQVQVERQVHGWTCCYTDLSWHVDIVFACDNKLFVASLLCQSCLFSYSKYAETTIPKIDGIWLLHCAIVSLYTARPFVCLNEHQASRVG